MIRLSQNIRPLLKNIHNRYTETHLIAKQPHIIEAYKLQCILRQCLTFNQIKQVILQNEDRFKKHGKTVILQFLNEFQIDPKYQQMEKPLQIYGFLQKFQDLNLYQLTIKYSIYKKISTYYDIQNEFLKTIQQKTKQLLIQGFNKVVQNHQQFEFKDAFNVLVTIDKQLNINKSFELIDQLILIYAKKIKFGRILYMIFKRLFQRGWKIIRKYHNVLYYLSEHISYNPQADLVIGIEFFHKISQLKIHVCGPRNLSHFMNSMTHNIFNNPQIQKLPRKSLIKLLQSFRNLPLSYQRQSFLKFYQFIQTKGYKMTDYIKYIPYNKLSIEYVSKIYQYLIAYELDELWQYGVYNFNSHRIRRNLLYNVKMQKTLTQIFEKRYLAQSYANITDFIRYLSFSIIIYQKSNVIASNPQKIIPIIITEIYFKFLQSLKKNKIKLYEEEMVNSSIGSLKNKKQDFQIQRLQILDILSVANIINLLLMMIDSKNIKQTQIIIKYLPSILRKRKQRKQDYFRQLLQVAQLYSEQKNLRCYQLENLIFIIILDLISKAEQSKNSDYLQLILKDQQLKLPQKLNLRFNFDIHLKILFNLIKRPPRPNHLKLCNLILNTLNPLEQILIIEYFEMEQFKLVHASALLLNFIIYQRKTNLKNIFLIIGGFPLKLLRSNKGVFYSKLKQYFINTDFNKGYQYLKKQKEQYLLNPTLYKYNSVKDFQLDIITAYQFLKVIITLTDKQVTKFILNFIIHFIKNFPTDFKSFHQFKRAHRFLQISIQFIKSITLKTSFQDDHSLFQSKNQQSYKQDLKIAIEDIHLIIAHIPQILNNLKNTKKYIIDNGLIQNVKTINLYSITKQLQIRCLISDVAPFSEVIKDSLVLQILNERVGSQIIFQVDMVLFKLYCFEFIQLESNFIKQIYSSLEKAASNGQISPGWLRYTFSSNNQQLIWYIKKIQIWQKYLIPLFKMAWDKQMLKKAMGDLIFFYLEILTKIRFQCTKVQSVKIVIQLICELSRHLIYGPLQSHDLKEIIKICLKIKNGEHVTLWAIKQQIQYNSDNFICFWDQIYYFWQKIYYDIPHIYETFIFRLQQETKNIMKTQLKGYENILIEEKTTQDIKKISKHFDLIYRFLWCCIKNKVEIGNKIAKMFVIWLPLMVKLNQGNSVLLSDYAKIYYYLVIDDIVSVRDKKLENLFEKLLMYEIEPNKKLESFLDNLKIKFVFKSKIHKTNSTKKNKTQQQQKILLPIQYYLPNSNEVLIVAKTYHFDIHQRKFNGDLKFEEVFFKTCTGKNVKIYNPRTNRFVQNEEKNLSPKEQKEISRIERPKPRIKEIDYQ